MHDLSPYFFIITMIHSEILKQKNGLLEQSSSVQSTEFSRR